MKGVWHNVHKFAAAHYSQNSPQAKSQELIISRHNAWT